MSVNETGAKPVATTAHAHHADHAQHAKGGAANAGAAKPAATKPKAGVLAHPGTHQQHAGKATIGTGLAFVTHAAAHHAQGGHHRTAQAAAKTAGSKTADKPSEGTMWASRQLVESLHAKVVDPSKFMSIESRTNYRNETREEYQHYLSLANRRFGANSEEVKEARATIRRWAESQNTELSKLVPDTISKDQYNKLKYPEGPAPSIKDAAPVKHAPSKAKAH
jgi:hypothetical protein